MTHHTLDPMPTHILDIHEACAKAYRQCFVACRREIKGGVLRGRGKWIAIIVTKDGKESPVYEGETYLWDGTKADLLSAQRHAKQFGVIKEVRIFGGMNHARDVNAMNNNDYDPLVGEWQVTIEGEFK